MQRKIGWLPPFLAMVLLLAFWSGGPPGAVTVEAAKRPTKTPTPTATPTPAPAATPTATPSSTKLPASAAGQVLVVNANLQEANSADDVEVTTDMRNFCRRLHQHLRDKQQPAPDVILVQEVIGPSARTVAQFCTQEFGYQFVVGIAPGDSANLGSDTVCGTSGTLKRETGVLLNADTMRAADAGGYISTCYTAAEDADGKPLIKQHAYQLVTELGTGKQVPVVSLHFNLTTDFIDADTGFNKKGVWSDQIASFLKTTYPDTVGQIRTIAGDFNNRRCQASGDEQVDCAVWPFWITLTGTHGYTDTIYSYAREEIGTPGVKRIDYVFAQGPVIDAASDLTYATDTTCKNDPNCFYSDHRFLWARVGA